MNIVLILVDSLNKEALTIYNPETVCKTPSLDAFAKKSIVFENHFISSLPCMPARREISAGRKEFMWRAWGPLEIFDPRLPREVQKQGYNTAIVTDHYHYWEETANGYVQGFMSNEFIRGHETDNVTIRRKDSEPAPKWIEKTCEFRAREHMLQYYENVKDFKGEEDFFPAKTFTAAAKWLDNYADRGPFFLQVENFDVHEPFHVPEPYASMYTDGIPGTADDYNIWPPYQMYDDLAAFMDQTTPDELAFLKAQYYGKTTMVDKWLGLFLDKIGEKDLWNDTLIIFTTDHGHDLGERGVFAKQYPHFDSHANIPMIVWDPRHCGENKRGENKRGENKRGNNRRVDALTQTVDIFSTIIEASGGQPPAATRHSKSIFPILEGAAAPRDAITYGTFGQGVCITDGEWTLFKSPVEGKELFVYSTMIAQPLIVDNPIDGRVGAMPPEPVAQAKFDPTVPYPMWKLPVRIDPRTYENYLFNRVADPTQTENLWETEPEQRERMLSLLRAYLDDEGYPIEQLARLGLDD